MDIWAYNVPSPVIFYFKLPSVIFSRCLGGVLMSFILILTNMHQFSRVQIGFISKIK